MRSIIYFYFGLSWLLVLIPCFSNAGDHPAKTGINESQARDFFIGWSKVEITPGKPVLVAGQFEARISEGILDPICVTALAMESGSGPSSEKVIMISCDLVSISDGTRDGNPDNLRDWSRKQILKKLPEIKPEQILINATHTHTRPYVSGHKNSKSIYGVDLDVMPPVECQKYIAERIAQAASEAWENRKPGGISYGFGHAVVGHNRLAVDFSGKSVMYAKTNKPEFSHVEGYEDHSVNLLYTWDKDSHLTGVVVNIAAPSQVTESLYKISADYWHETRLEIQRRLGENVFVLPQCSAAGDQSPHLLIDEKAETRMQKLMFPDDAGEYGDRTQAYRKQIAIRIADAVTSVFQYMKDHIEWTPVFGHRMEVVELSRRLISIEDVDNALKEGEKYRERYEKMVDEIRKNPSIKEKPRWYTEISSTSTHMNRGYGVKERYEREKKQPASP